MDLMHPAQIISFSLHLFFLPSDLPNISFWGFMAKEATGRRRGRKPKGGLVRDQVIGP